MIKVEYKGEEKIFFVEEVLFMVFNKMKEIVEVYFGKVCISYIYFINKFEFLFLKILFWNLKMGVFLFFG